MLLLTKYSKLFFFVQEIDKAIRAVTDMNPDYSVEKIEIERRTATD